MGNQLGKRRQVVDDKYTRPQGLFDIKHVDYKKLRKLILHSKLAPCYPARDDSDSNLLEECPICFLYYPTLNRSRCCTKSICTECFLQMKNPGSTRPTQCPFCKTSNYAVEYRGMKSKEERGMEELEEQKVIEAKIRMRQQELLEEEERQQRKAEMGSLNREEQTGNPDCSPSSGLESEEITRQDSRTTQIVSPQIARQNRDGELDLDLEDIMVMEAIWLSIQENGTSELCISPPPASSSSPSGGLACAIAALAECQQLNSESSHNDNGGHVTPSDMLPSSSTNYNYKRVKKSQRNRPHAHSSSAKDMYSGGASEVTEVETSSDDFDAGPSSPPPPLPPLSGRRRRKRVKNDPRKSASLERASSGDTTCQERMFEGGLQCESDYGMAGTSYGSSDESDEGAWTTALPLPPPPYDEAAVPPLPLLLLHGGTGVSMSSKRIKHDRKRYSLHQRASGGERVTADDDWEPHYGSVVAEAGTTYGSCNESDETTTPSRPLPLYDGGGTSGSCSDDGGYLALPPPPPPLPSTYGWWHSALQSPVQ